LGYSTQDVESGISGHYSKKINEAEARILHEPVTLDEIEEILSFRETKVLALMVGPWNSS